MTNRSKAERSSQLGTATACPAGRGYAPVTPIYSDALISSDPRASRTMVGGDWLVLHRRSYLDSLDMAGARDIRTMTLAWAYAAMGVTAAAFPAALPSVAAFAGVGVERLLPGISLLFGALLVGVLGVSALQWVDPRRCLAAGSLLQAMALVLMAVGRSEASFLVACSVAGLGFGLAEASANLLTRLLAAEKTATELAGMTAMTAAAAAVCPLVLAFAAGAQAGFVVTLDAWRSCPSRLRSPYSFGGPDRPAPTSTTSGDTQDAPEHCEVWPSSPSVCSSSSALRR